MAYAFGTVTDHNDFMTKLLEFASGTDASTFSGSWTTGGVVPSDEQWTILTNSIPTSGTGSATGMAFIQGPGSESGDDIIIGMRTYNNVSGFIYGTEFRGYTDYDNTLTFDTMPGVSPSTLVATKGGSFSAWFWVNGRRIMATARIDGLYDITFYLGFFLQYGTHSQYPYPLMITGTMCDETQPYTRADYGHTCLPDILGNQGTYKGMYFRWIDGTWIPVWHWAGIGVSNNGRSNNGWALYPLEDNSTSDNAEYGGQTEFSELTLLQQWSPSQVQFSPLEVNAYPLFPVVLNAAIQLPGQIDGMYVVPGDGLAPGDTITISGTVYDVFHNVWRSTDDCFYCIPRI